MTKGPTTAMVLAAGLGKRMRPITDTIPKPLVKVAGRTLLDWGLDSLAGCGVRKAVVNVHYFPEQIVAHVASRKAPTVVVSDESDALLDSAGGIVKALPELGDAPFYILNADTFWIDEIAPVVSVPSVTDGWNRMPPLYGPMAPLNYTRHARLMCTSPRSSCHATRNEITRSGSTMRSRILASR